jgi:hypothetical protein
MFLIFVPVTFVSTTYATVYNLPGAKLIYFPSGCFAASCYGVKSTSIGSITYGLFKFGGLLNQSWVGQIASLSCAAQCFQGGSNTLQANYEFIVSGNAYFAKQRTSVFASSPCTSLEFPQYTVSAVPASWTYSSCLFAANAYNSQEVYYTIAGPYGSTFIVNATVIAQHAVSIQLIQSNTLTTEGGSAEPMNSNETSWNVSVTPCLGTVTCSIDIVNNSTQDNPFTMRLQATQQ